MFAAGNEVPKGTNPWALCYGGHQFGSWAGQLGDGRAITLGEITTPKDEKYELQLKGAGLTPYSRFADGFAVLRSSVREFLCSEAMHHLGIPTTRALSLVGSARKIQRETEETGAVVLRVAPTWVRFGSFEIFLARGDIDRMRSLADWVIKHHFPEILSSDSPHKYSDWLQEIVRRTAVMIAGWQSVGFCHGVMNTDNMSILGLTLDYGPFQFLDAYESGYVCNHSDTSGRYSFEAQPGVGLWNLGKLASAVSPLIVGEHGGNKEAAEQGLRKILTDYGTTYQREYRTRMANKLGLSHIVDEDFELLVRPLLAVLEKEEADYTWFFRTLSTEFRLASSTSNTSSAILPDPSSTFELSTGPLAGPTATPPPLANHYPLAGPLHTWYQTYRARLLQDLSPIPSPAEVAAADETRQARMLSINPRYILRNHLAQRAIAEAESGSYAGVRGLLKVLQRPFDDGTEEEQRTWGSWDVPSWAKGMKCSCSS
ncbi:hypothetical protein DFS34DRAFT_699721 [Phlyctochytrium arcticum]|nr:hypothetical protein DFS34DRAFT_699721 [Phlyctochytrium arcticum]